MKKKRLEFLVFFFFFSVRRDNVMTESNQRSDGKLALSDLSLDCLVISAVNSSARVKSGFLCPRCGLNTDLFSVLQNVDQTIK